MAVITYDVSARQSEVKDYMLARGYLDAWGKDGTTFYLPYSTLWRPDTRIQTALSDIQAAAAAHRVSLERAIALPHETWWGIPGVPH